MTNGKSGNEFKNIFNSRFTFAILSKIFNGYRPAKIAEQLHISPQRLNYHTDRLIEADLISKDNDEYNGITWRLTDKGLFILKQKLTWSVNNSNNNNRHTFRPRGALPVRLENICFAFKVIKPIPENLNLNWVNIKNGVAKSTIKYRDHTIELVKSNEVGNGSVILIHLKREYLFDWVQGLIQQYNLALHYCIKAAQRLGLNISEYGYLVKRPHVAFERDLIALFLATSHIAEINTKGAEEGKAWIDSSNGSGELEMLFYI